MCAWWPCLLVAFSVYRLSLSVSVHTHTQTHSECHCNLQTPNNHSASLVISIIHLGEGGRQGRDIHTRRGAKIVRDSRRPHQFLDDNSWSPTKIHSLLSLFSVTLFFFSFFLFFQMIPGWSYSCWTTAVQGE